MQSTQKLTAGFIVSGLNYLDEDYYGSYGISVSYQDSESGKSVGNAFVGPYEKIVRHHMTSCLIK